MNPDGSLQFSMTNDKERNQKTSLVLEKLAYLKKLKRKYPHLKTMFAVGGWDNSQFFLKMVHDQNLIKNFVYSALNLLDTYDLDGVDIDWEHPVIGGAVEGQPDDRQLYVEFMRVFRYAMNIQSEKKNKNDLYLLSFAGSACHTTLDEGYDLERLLEIVDWVNVMSYDYFGAWNSKWGAYTGPPASLYHGAPRGYSGKMNADFTLKYYTC
jgi:GH18 family chitinase